LSVFVDFTFQYLTGQSWLIFSETDLFFFAFKSFVISDQILSE